MITIRRADPQEAEALGQIAFSAKAYWGYPARWMQIWQPQFDFTPQYLEENESWVAEVDQRPIAFYTLFEKQGIAWLENLWVSPEHIGAGIGRTLFDHAREVARSRGFGRLQLEAEPNALGFYQRMGMTKVGERSYEIEGQPRTLPLMELDL